MEAKNVTRGTVVANCLSIADTYWRRALGLIGQSGLASGEGLWIVPCQGVHMFGMRFSIDVIFLDETKRVVALCENLKPFRATKIKFDRHSALEVPVETIAQTKTQIGDQIEIGEKS